MKSLPILCWGNGDYKETILIYFIQITKKVYEILDYLLPTFDAICCVGDTFSQPSYVFIVKILIIIVIVIVNYHTNPNNFVFLCFRLGWLELQHRAEGHRFEPPFYP